MQTRLEFMSVQVRDLDVSRGFYTRALGFDLAEHSPPGAAVLRDARGATFALRTLLPQTDPAQALGVGVSLWFAAEDIGAAHARVLAGGGRAYCRTPTATRSRSINPERPVLKPSVRRSSRSSGHTLQCPA